MIDEHETLTATMERLLEPDAAGRVGWMTRVHRAIVRAHPDGYVFRLTTRLKDLTSWLRDTATPEVHEQCTEALTFDRDRGGLHALPEGGCLRFRWQGSLYHVYSICVWAERQDQTHSWVVAPGREEGESLALELTLRARGEPVRVQVFANGEWPNGMRLEGDLARHSWGDIIESCTGVRETRQISCPESGILTFSPGAPVAAGTRHNHQFSPHRTPFRPHPGPLDRAEALNRPWRPEVFRLTDHGPRRPPPSATNRKADPPACRTDSRGAAKPHLPSAPGKFQIRRALRPSSNSRSSGV